jgi:hypothetical protein
MNALNRHWYQFSLRTMFVLVFVVSVPLAWVGYSLNWIRQRHAVISSGVVDSLGFGSDNTTAVAPAGLWLFGENGIHHLWVRHDAKESIDDLQRLFPEAGIHRW